jgi:hypothetical protein
MLHRLRVLLASAWLTCLVALGVQAAPSVVIVSSENSAAYVDTAQSLIDELERSGVSRYSVLTMSASEGLDARAQSPRLYIALGADAMDLLARSGPAVPVLGALLPRSSFEAILQRRGRKATSQFSALFLDQAPARQFDLIHLAFPSVRRIGVLWGPGSARERSELRSQAQVAALQLVEADVGNDQPLFPALRQVVDGTDLLLAVPNPEVYNSNTIQNILLTSFRAHVPMMAFSPAYVRAGALLAVYVTPHQVGVQAAQLARAAMDGKALPVPGAYSTEFQISVNEHVARSFGLSLDAQDLNRRLRRREALP